MKLTQAQCETLWNQANPSKGQTLSQSQAQPFVSDFKSVDTDSDGSISQTEFMTGCNNGYVKDRRVLVGAPVQAVRVPTEPGEQIIRAGASSLPLG
jgi:hypothetical protein